MKANPGGHISPSDVVGRDELIANLWRVLKRQSLVLSAERRMGKTCVIQKMDAEAPADMLTIYRDLEKIHTPLEFADSVFQDVEEYLGLVQKTATRARQFLSHLKGAELGKVIKIPEIGAPHWKDLLTHTLADLVEHQDKMVVLFWDELPHMIYNIARRNGADTAMEVLDALRALRQTYPSLRMVFTGSIGLHNVITSLKRSGYANAPTNDMATLDVPPLSLDKYAPELALRLIEGEGIVSDDRTTLAMSIAVGVDGIPFYVQHVVDQIVMSGKKADVALVEAIVRSKLTDPLDSWNLKHYRERLDTYYTADELPFAVGFLDILAGADRPLNFTELFNLLKSKIVTEESEAARAVLTLLQRDHYVIQNAEGDYSFRFPLIKRWWRIDRGI
ncbi:MAG TPA: hypothetical protein VI298_00795 [Geobacteraceae bacterium]